MEIENSTPFEAEPVAGCDPSGRMCMGVVVKATFAIPDREQRASICSEQIPLLKHTRFYEDSENGEVLLEEETAYFKDGTNVALVGKAVAPGGKPVGCCNTYLKVGSLTQAAVVFGERRWVSSCLGSIYKITRPEPFVTMELRYSNAYGGIDRKTGCGFPFNFRGKGFAAVKSGESLKDLSLPNIEAPLDRITKWDSRPPVAGYGFWPKESPPRSRALGDLRGAWNQNAEISLPEGFRFGFFRSAHPRLKVSGYLKGDEDVEMFGFTPRGFHRFGLSGIAPVLKAKGPVPTNTGQGGVSSGCRVPMPLDTICFLPEKKVFFQLWRALTPISDLEENDISGFSVSI